MRRSQRIVLTGGPGGGKTTAADLFRRELGETVVVVPEAATMLFAGGYPRHREAAAIRATQLAIYQVQLGLEYTQSAAFPDRTLLCDRGTVDGAAHWPDGPSEFFEQNETDIDQELGRYDAVLFFQSAAVGGLQIEGGNPTRTETLAEACALDAKLHDLYCRHLRFFHVPHQRSFVKKITEGLAALHTILKT